MAKLMWAITCEKIINDTLSNSVSYITAVEGLAAYTLPQRCPLIYIGMHWLRDCPGEPIQLRILMTGPEDEVLLDYKPDPTKLAGPEMRQRFNVQIGGMQIKKAGPLSIKIMQMKDGAWQTEQELQIDVTLFNNKDIREISNVLHTGALNKYK